MFILPVNFIRKPTTYRTSKKQNRLTTSSTNQSVLSSLFCGVKDKVTNRTTRNRHSFIEPFDSGSCSEFSTSSNNTKRSLTPEAATANFHDGKMNNIKSGGSGNKLPSSVSSPNLAKQDSASSSTSSSNRLLVSNDLINLSEEYGRNMAERERRVHEERERRMSGSRGTQTLSSSSNNSGNGDVIRTPKSKKKALILQPAPNRDIKPSTILRLEDRDLVVIDRQDIKEAVRNESDVIIVDPPPMTQNPIDNNVNEQHAELSDILGSQWPALAGAGGALLNSEKRGNSSTSNSNGWRTIDRNKSANIASHFSSSGTKSRYDTQNNGYRNSE